MDRGSEQRVSSSTWWATQRSGIVLLGPRIGSQNSSMRQESGGQPSRTRSAVVTSRMSTGSLLDISAVTGESIPIEAVNGDVVLAGSMAPTSPNGRCRSRTLIQHDNERLLVDSREFPDGGLD